MKISVIIPTHNEERNLPRAIGLLRQTSEPGGIEIIVVDAKSVDRTFEVARGLADRVLEAAVPGRAAGMNRGALVSSGEVLLFLHADTRLPDNWHSSLRRAWSGDDKPAATAFRLKYDSDKPFYRFLAAATNVRSAWTGIPHGDQAIAVERKTFFQVGGFSSAPLMEEYILLGKLKRLGNIRLLADPVTTSTRRYEKNGPVFNALRNTLLIGLFYAGVSPRTLAKLYW